MEKLAIVFPGQGSQAVGMGRELAAKYGSAAAIYQQAHETLGWDISDLSFNGPAEELSRTENAQVALYVHSMAAMTVLSESGITPGAVSGHSLGEYSALAAAGALSFNQCLDLVATRGQVMGQAAAERPGAMAAIIGLEDETVEEICTRSGEVWPVNYNCPGQLVISGETESVMRALAAADTAGARKAVRLPVSGAFHSPLMRAAAGRMKEELSAVRFRDPGVPFLSPTSCEYEDAAGLNELLVRQVVSPVRWRQSVEQLIADGYGGFLEVGNGKVLSGLIRRISRDVKTYNFSSPEDLESVLALV